MGDRGAATRPRPKPPTPAAFDTQVELQPDRESGRAAEVRRWSQWDHLVQDFDPARANYVADVAAHPTKLDLNYAPPGGKAACRSGGLQPYN